MTGRGFVAMTVLIGTALSFVVPPHTVAAQTAASFGFFIDAPFVQTAYYEAAGRSNVQTFDSLSLGTAANPQTWSGISKSDGVTGTWRIVTGDQWGGAHSTLPASVGDPQLLAPSGGTRSRYAIIDGGSAPFNTLTVDLATPATCLGFWWSAGDASNQLQFFTTVAGGAPVQVATITTGDLTAKLADSAPIVSLGGTPYDRLAYYGHPVGPRDSSQSNRERQWGPLTGPPVGPAGEMYPYIFVHAIASGGFAFDRVVMSQTGSGGFEFDNFTVDVGCVARNELVFIAESIDPDFAASQSALVIAPPHTVSSPELTCAPVSAAPGATVTCDVVGGDPGIDILWEAGTFAGQGVRLDASGRGTFSFVVPTRSDGPFRVELVDWGVAKTLTVDGLGPVPTSVPAGEGQVPRTPAALMLLLLAATVLSRMRRPLGVRD